MAGVEVVVKVDAASRVSVDSTSDAASFPILVIEAADGTDVLITPAAAYATGGALVDGDLTFADQLVTASRIYRNGLARRLGRPEI